MYIKDHRLQGDCITQYACPKNTQKIRKHIALVLHYTANNNALKAVKYLTLPGVNASAHVIIGRNGEVYQTVPFNIEAWHAGKSELDNLHELNHFSIGIELVNQGKLIFENNRYYNWHNKVVDSKDVFIKEDPNTGHRSFWHRYTPVQLAMAKEVTWQITNHYHISKVVGHSEISPDRKLDPGEAFPMDQFKQLVYKQNINRKAGR
ncbi:N-acetylmuramoyl-L-alanine amidase [Puteibacter caeruleilacunae]|nr:N-acetylmuramoyl-L-alanine amidase [Puteibacter caeruleilacunae]